MVYLISGIFDSWRISFILYLNRGMCVRFMVGIFDSWYI